MSPNKQNFTLAGLCPGTKGSSGNWIQPEHLLVGAEQKCWEKFKLYSPLKLLRRQCRSWCTEQLPGVSRCPALRADTLSRARGSTDGKGHGGHAAGDTERDGLKNGTSLLSLGSPSPAGQILPVWCSRSGSVTHTQMGGTAAGCAVPLPLSCQGTPQLLLAPGPTLHGITYL